MRDSKTFANFLRRFFLEKIFCRRLNPIAMPNEVDDDANCHDVARVRVSEANKVARFSAARHEMKVKQNSRDDANQTADEKYHVKPKIFLQYRRPPSLTNSWFLVDSWY